MTALSSQVQLLPYVTEEREAQKGSVTWQRVDPNPPASGLFLLTHLLPTTLVLNLALQGERPSSYLKNKTRLSKETPLRGNRE